MNSLHKVPQPESVPAVGGCSFDPILHLHRFAAEVLRKSIAPLASRLGFLLTPEYLSSRFSAQIGVVWRAPWGLTQGVDASLHEDYSKTAVDEAARAVPPAAKRT